MDGGFKKTAQWALTFAVLTSFSFYAVGNVTGYGQQVALAQVIEENQDLLDDGGVLVLAAEDERELRRQQREAEREQRREEREEERVAREAEREAERAAREEERDQRRFQRFLDRFQRYYDRQVLCVLTDEQKSAVELLYDTSLQSLSLSDATVDILTAEGERLRASDLRNLVRSSGGDATGELRCRVIDHQNIFYLLFTGSVS